MSHRDDTRRDCEAQVVLLRFSGDISTKARATRSQFVRRLLHNLRDALACENATSSVECSHDRAFAKLPRGLPPDALARVFGVQSLSPVERSCELSLEAIVETGAELFRERVRGRRFAVRARRVGDRSRIPVTARDVESALGAALLSDAAGVDLDHPELTARLELHERKAYLYTERVPGFGGLPVGVEGRALALVSGGFDSAVAAWQLLKRGVALDYVFCNLGGRTHEQGVLRATKVLSDRWSYGYRPRLHSIDFQPVSEALQAGTARRYWQILLKRMMLRAAERIANQSRAPAIATGEAIGQVSSQTLQNLAVISQAISHTILRPLVGFNKEEIIELAERIGTAEISKVVAEYCAMVPHRPATRATLEDVLKEEAKLDLDVVERCVAERAEIDLRAVDVEKLELPDLEIEAIPDGATVIDVRSRREYDAWHYPDAVRLDFAEALRAYPHFGRDQTYVAYCEFGLLSAHLVELMRREGLDAYHVRGGRRALQRLVSGSGRAR